MEMQKKVESYIEESRGEMLELWEELVNTESYVGEADNVNRALAIVKREFEAEGFDCRIEDVGGGWGLSLIHI